MTMNAVAMIQANTTSQMIVERPKDADLFWFWRLKGEESEVCNGASMIFASLNSWIWRTVSLREASRYSAKTSFCQFVPRSAIRREGICRS